MERFRNILCVITPEERHRTFFEQVVSLAESNQARLTVNTVIPFSSLAAMAGVPVAGSDEFLRKCQAEGKEKLEQFLQPWRERVDISTGVLAGKAFLEIIRAVLRNQFDLVVKPADKSGVVQRLLGSDDMHLLRKCPCPVWLADPEGKGNNRKIIAAVDFDLHGTGSEDEVLNAEIMALASSLAIANLAELHVVHAWDSPDELAVLTWSNNPVVDASRLREGTRERHQASMDQLREQLLQQLGRQGFDLLSPQFHLVKGPASRVIPERARQLDADLVVMGTVARTGIPGLFIGNTAESILGQLSCSVLAIKPPGFSTPVTLIS